MTNLISIENELIIVSTETIHKLFSYENWSDAVALYMFYHKQCKLQMTNQSFSTSDFVKKWMGWGQNRFINAKNLLKELDLVQDVNERDEKWMVTGWFIKLNYIKPLNKAILSTSLETEGVDNPTPGLQETNAWSSKTINAWSSKTESSEPKKSSRIKKKEFVKVPLPSKEEVFSFMWDKKGVRKFYNLLSSVNLQQNFTLEQIKETYEWMVEFFMDKYEGKFYLDVSTGDYVGTEIVMNELDKFTAHYAENFDEKEVKNVKSRLTKWIINSVKFNNQ